MPLRLRAPLTLLAATLLLALPTGSRGGAAQETAPLLQQAMGMLRAQNFQSAVELLDSLTERQPRNAQAWSLLGFALRNLDRPGDAIEAYRSAVSLPDAPPGAFFNLGLLLALHGDADEGFAYLGRAKESGALDVTQIDLDPAAAPLRDDPRYRELFPTEEELADPFVEPATIIHEWRGEAVNDQFGWIARNIGDVDGDGVNDVTTSAPTWDGPEGEDAGRVYVYSGASGELLWTAEGAGGDQLGLGIEAAGDVNADGIPDVVAGAPGGDYARVWSGRDGTVLFTFEAPQPGSFYGRKVGDVGDVDGDGHDDLILGAPRDDRAGEDAGRAFVHSGRTGEIILELAGEEAGDQFGASAGGHTDRRGRMTLVVGAPGAGPGNRGATYVYKELTSEPAFVIESDPEGRQLGAMFVSAVGDVDGDGVVDVYASDWAGDGADGLARAGRAYIHSGANGRRLYTLTGEAEGDGFGIGVADAGDVDGDGHDDFLIGAWQHGGQAPSGGKVYLYSGRDGGLVRTLTGKVMGETFGFDATGMGDVDGDGVVDFLLTSAWSSANGGRSGRVFIISGAEAPPSR